MLINIKQAAKETVIFNFIFEKKIVSETETLFLNADILLQKAKFCFKNQYFISKTPIGFKKLYFV